MNPMSDQDVPPEYWVYWCGLPILVTAAITLIPISVAKGVY
jgi:hypothetical protein